MGWWGCEEGVLDVWSAMHVGFQHWTGVWVSCDVEKEIDGKGLSCKRKKKAKKQLNLSSESGDCGFMRV